MTRTTTIQIKIGLYTPKEQWMATDIHAAPQLIAQHIDEPTGIYIPLSYHTEHRSVRSIGVSGASEQRSNGEREHGSGRSMGAWEC